MLQLIVSATILLAGGVSGADATLIGRYTLPSDGDVYGGLSAAHVSDDGRKILMVSDRGTLVSGEIIRDPAGQIVDMLVSAPVPITPLDDDSYYTLLDSEGLAVAPDGTIYVSFEGRNRVGRFATITSQEEPLPRMPAFDALHDNSGLEALAIDADGALYTLPERSGRYDRPFPVYRYANGKWTTPYAIPRTQSYLMVGADFGPDGKLYLLERDFSGIGFYTRVRRVDLQAQTAETILETGLGVHGNMEGISVWRNAAGEMIMTLIADDNFNAFLNNEIAEYRING